MCFLSLAVRATFLREFILRVALALRVVGPDLIQVGGPGALWGSVDIQHEVHSL